MVNMTDIFGNALSIAGSFMDSDLVNRFMMVIFAVILVFGVLNCILGYKPLLWVNQTFQKKTYFFFPISSDKSCAGGCTYNGNTGEINNADRSTGGGSCVRSDRISDL